MFIIIIIIVTIIIIVILINISSCHNSILHPLRLKLEAFITNNQPRTKNYIPLIPLTVFSHCCSITSSDLCILFQDSKRFRQERDKYQTAIYTQKYENY